MADQLYNDYDSATPLGVVGRDEYIVEQDEMGDSRPQENLIDYLKAVLKWLYHDEGWMVAANFNEYHPAVDNSQKLIVPDIAVFKDIYISQLDQERLTSWNMRKNPKLKPPPVVMEIGSKETWDGDIELENKPRLYGLVGMREYFAYDPNDPRVWPKQYSTRLLGWRYGADKQPVPILPDERGWLWSEVLESWLGADGYYLRLYDRAGQRRLKADEFTQRDLFLTQQQLEAERIASEQRLEAERREREAERIANEQKLEEERRQREAERIANEQKLEAERQANAELRRMLDELQRRQNQ